jgi:hypothetical protein
MVPEIWTVDIETRPNEVYTWSLHGEQHVGLNQVIRPGGLLMFAAQKHGTKAVESYADWVSYEGMVMAAHRIYDQADYIVTYNGVRFDNKHLRAAWVELGLTPPSPWRDIDLYRTVGKLNFPSRKLAYVCGALGLDCKTDPGGMATWDQILRGTDEEKVKAQRRMERYCKNDVRITTQLFERLRPWVDGLNLPLYAPDDVETAPSCTRCGGTEIQSRGYAYTTTYRYRRYCCTTCGGWMRDRRSEPTPNAELRNA